MDNNKNFQKIILKEISHFFDPLLTASGDLDSLLSFLENLGWNLEPIIQGNENDFLIEFNAIVNLVENLDSAIEDPLETIETFIGLLSNIGDTLNSFKQLHTLFSSLGDLGLDKLPGDVLSYLAVNYLYEKKRTTYYLLSLIGVIKEEENEILTLHNNQPIKVPFTENKLNLSRIIDFITNPLQVLEEEYWPNGATDLNTVNEIGEKLFTRLGNLLLQLGISVFVGRGNGPYYHSEEDEERMKGMMTARKIFNSFNEITQTGISTEIGATIGLIPEAQGAPGFFIVPFGEFNISKTLGDWVTTGNLEAGIFGFEITSNGFDIWSDAADVNVNLELQVRKRIELIEADDGTITEEPAMRFGSNSGTRLEIGHLAFQGFLTLGTGDPDYGLALDVRKGAFIVSPKDGDGFIKKILPPEGLQADFDFLLGWAKSRGFHFGGSAGLEVSIPIRKPILGFLDLKSIDLGIKADENGIGLEVGTSGNVELGPVIATVDKIGLQTQLTFPEDDGNLGVMNADLKFKPPSGIGLTLDSKGFKGGGYLYLGNNRYVGVVTLNFKDKINFTAIGILTTKAPDGSEGFSLLLIITADGFKPIQLGLGFTLDGIGGLIALNRTIKIDALREGVRTNAFDNILFPDNPVENISIIVQDLEKVFR